MASQQPSQEDTFNLNREIRFFESESIDSLAVPGLEEEYLVLSFPGGVRCGKLFNKGGNIGLLSNSLQFNLLTFTDVLAACEAMIASMPNKLKNHLPQHLVLPKKKVTKATLGERLDADGKAEFCQEGACFYIEESPRYRLACLYYLDGTVGLGRAFCKYDITHGAEGEEGSFEIAKGSLLKFESIGHYVRFLKSLFDQCLAAYSKRSHFIPIVFFIFNKIVAMTKTERDQLNTNKQAIIENLLPQACQFAGNEVSYLAKEPKKFTALVPFSFYVIEEVVLCASFFKHNFKYLDIGETYIGDEWDHLRILAPKKTASKSKKRPALAPLDLNAARSSASTQEKAKQEEVDSDDDDDEEFQASQDFFGKKK